MPSNLHEFVSNLTTLRAGKAPVTPQWVYDLMAIHGLNPSQKSFYWAETEKARKQLGPDASAFDIEFAVLSRIRTLTGTQ